MATTRFKNTSNATWKTLKTINTEWKFDIYGVTPKVIEGELEEFQMVSYGGGPFGFMDSTLEPLTMEGVATNGDVDDRYGSIDVEFENDFELVMGGSQLNPLFGDIDIEFEEDFVLEMEGAFAPLLYGDISATLLELTCEMQAHFFENELGPTLYPFDYASYSGASMDAHLPLFQMEGYMAANIEASLENFTCTMDSLFGASVKGTLQEFSLIASGATNYIAFEPNLGRITAAMYSGAHFKSDVPVFQFTSQGQIINQGNLKATLRQMLFSSQSGAIIRATLPKFELSMLGITPVKTELTLETRTLKCTIHATSDAVESLLATLRQLTLRIEGSQVNPGDETTLEATLKRLQATITGVQGYPGKLKGSLRDFVANFTATMESIDSLTATLEIFTLVMRAYTSESIGGIIFDASEDCEPFETIEYGVVQ